MRKISINLEQLYAELHQQTRKSFVCRLVTVQTLNVCYTLNSNSSNCLTNDVRTLCSIRGTIWAVFKPQGIYTFESLICHPCYVSRRFVGEKRKMNFKKPECT